LYKSHYCTKNGVYLQTFDLTNSTENYCPGSHGENGASCYVTDPSRREYCNCAEWTKWTEWSGTCSGLKDSCVYGFRERICKGFRNSKITCVGNNFDKNICNTECGK